MWKQTAAVWHPLQINSFSLSKRKNLFHPISRRFRIQIISNPSFLLWTDYNKRLSAWHERHFIYFSTNGICWSRISNLARLHTSSVMICLKPTNTPIMIIEYSNDIFLKPVRCLLNMKHMKCVYAMPVSIKYQCRHRNISRSVQVISQN